MIFLGIGVNKTAFAWVCLGLAVLFEMGWPVGMKLALDPEKKMFGIVLTVVCLILSGVFLWFAQKEIVIGTSYAIWTGLGAAGTFLIGVRYFGDPAGGWKYVGVGLIIAGVVVLNLAPATPGE